MEKKEYQLMHSVEDDHWWYVGLRRLVRAFIDRYTDKNDEHILLDAGCGTGGMLAGCRDLTAFGLDISEEAIKFCRMRKLENISSGSISDMPYKDNFFHIVISLDVLYHRDVSDDSYALTEFYRVMDRNGVLLLNLPAYNFLKGPHDKMVHTRQRYTVREVRDKIEKAGFTVERITYRNALLFPAVAVMRITKKLLYRKSEEAESDVKALPELLNRFLKGILFLENSLILHGLNFPFGLSVFCVARKK